jgi:putative peptide zinc metalloprotease protein
VESEHRSGVYFRTEGFVVQALHRPGDFVKAGEPIVICESDRLAASIEFHKAKIAETESLEGQAASRGEFSTAETARQFVKTLRKQLEFFQEQHDRLTVRAPHDGVVVGPDPKNLVGSFVQEGQGMCEVVDLGSVRVVATLTQPEAAWLYELNVNDYKVELRRSSNVDEVLPAKTDKVLAGGTRALPHPSLGFPGGGKFEVEQRDQSGLTTKRPLFTAYFSPEVDRFEGKPGERVALRFTLPRKPLVSQWVDRLEKLVQGRVQL